jgi:hypothetical protein
MVDPAAALATPGTIIISETEEGESAFIDSLPKSARPFNETPNAG